MLNAAPQSIARDWNEQILDAIRHDTPHPPVHARNLFHLSVCMYDAWAAYDTHSVGHLYHAKHMAGDVAAARREAISYAAYRLLRQRYVYSKTASNTLATFDLHMSALGYNTNNFSLDTNSPAGLGNTIYSLVSSYFLNDGAFESYAYVDQNGYTPVNPPLTTGLPGNPNVVDINRWQPLAIANGVDQNGFPLGPIQTFLGSQWLGVRTFAIDRTNSALPWIDPGPQPRLNGFNDAQFRDEVVEVIRYSSQVTPDDGVMIDISPGSFGNNNLGANDGTGHPLNPATGMPYPPNLVKRGDFGRVLAEFWADGPNSETPPGHWDTLANQVSDNTNLVKRIGGIGPIVDDLEWDVKLYFTLNGAVHDAACAAWGVKRYYDGGRPIQFIRTMGQWGQSSEPGSPAYNTNGLPLVTNLIELVTTSTAAPGGRHQGLKPGAIAIYAWGGQPADPVNQYSGARWIAATNWFPYQKATFVTPSFAGYISGHSTFSRAGAEVLAAFTGSPFFPGGMGTYTSVSNVSLAFEKGPSETIQLQWGTYFDASDQAGISRLWGGIHVAADDVNGRITGSQCGQQSWAMASKYFDGSIANTPFNVTIRPLNSTQCELRFAALRGFNYELQVTPTPSHPFTNALGGPVLATETFMVKTQSVAGANELYRVRRTP